MREGSALPIEVAIRGLLGERHMSLKQLARESGVGRDTLYAWFDGQRPQPETLQRVAEALRVSPDRLLGKESQETELVAAIDRHAESVRYAADHIVRAFSENQNALTRLLSEALGLPPPTPDPDSIAAIEQQPVPSGERRDRSGRPFGGRT